MKTVRTIFITLGVLAGSACSASSPDPVDGVDRVSQPSLVDAAPTDAALADRSDLSGSVVRIATAGTFVVPDIGELDSIAGSGSGFIVEESGLVVTNNHVVAGAASIKVFVNGSDGSVAATVVAQSECSDLAVIDLDGDGYTSLGWSVGEAAVGLSVSAAGFPDGVEELVVTQGIVAEIDGDGATPWAAIASLIRHDAVLEAGNSGGPIIGSDGRVLGVNVAGAGGVEQFAIPVDVARPVVEQLMAGVDVDSIGLNVAAVVDDVTGESGVWVVSVEAGSVASDAGLAGGDVITRLDGLRVGRDGTLSDYCSVIRTAGTGPVPVELTRDGEPFGGVLRGEPVVALLTALSTATASTAAEPEPTNATPIEGEPHVEFDSITDRSGTFTIDVPTRWAHLDIDSIRLADADRPSIEASTDLVALDESIFDGDYSVAGIGAFVAGTSVPAAEAIDLLSATWSWRFDCSPLEAELFDDDVYSGVFQLFLECGDTASTVLSLGVERPGQSRRLWINIFAPTVADLEASVRIISSIDFAGELPDDFDTNPPATQNDPTTPSTTLDDDDLDTAPLATSTSVDEASVEEAASTIAPDSDADTEFGSASGLSVSDDADDFAAMIGIPPGESGLESKRIVYQTTTWTYRSFAGKSELLEWVKETTEQLGCGDSYVGGDDSDGFWYHSTFCNYAGDVETGAQFSYALRIYKYGDRTDVEVAVTDRWAV